MEILQELEKFNNIIYYDEPHIYTIDGVKQTSVTTLLGKYKEKFNADFWSRKKAEERNVSQAEILAEWETINKIATTKGSIVHNYVENLLARKVFPYPTQMVIDTVGKENAPLVAYKVSLINILVDKFVNDIKGKLLPIKSELVVGEQALGICGMVDQLFWNHKAKQYQIWDWKTNKKLAMTNKYGKKLLGGLHHLDECEYIVYCLQLSIYKQLIERNTGIKIGDLYIVWFFEDNPNYKVIKCLDLKREAEFIFDEYELMS
jgi:ATP-dependent exoDNAse (exonuclease V) beta subunit